MTWAPRRVLVLIAAATAVAGCGDDGSLPQPSFNPPRSDAERQAARIAVQFARHLQKRDAHAACALAREAALRELSCGSDEPLAHWLRVPADKQVKAVDISPGRTRRAYRVGIPATVMLIVEVDANRHVVALDTAAYA